ncbi:DM13 domain-containing protein [Arthrobacter sp.]|uniref:DM13 domain-containing protein n=1 Tax=Arthrobacter sp. TaxID=1667 RepID=UPI002810F17A|nr:DM13 domain-containing protein [Arthrobacter sp.]
MEFLKRRNVLAMLIPCAVAVLLIGAYLFQPWRLFTSSTLNEALPEAVSASSSPSNTTAVSPSSPTESIQPTPSAATAGAPVSEAAPIVVAKGDFQSQEHPTSGTASLLKLADGTQLVRLENLASSDGPDIKIWLSELDAGGDWFKYRGGKYLDLGPIKATHGSHNYVIPAGADLSGLDTVVLWCDRFSVAFGSAALA